MKSFKDRHSDLDKKFLNRVKKTDTCWTWIGELNDQGYGIFNLGKRHKRVRAHRYSYVLHGKGALVPGLVIDHLCRNTACVNPAHLEQVTEFVNVVERGRGYCAQQKIKTHCIRGHELIGPNLINCKTRPNSRMCRICQNVRRQERRSSLQTKPPTS